MDWISGAITALNNWLTTNVQTKANKLAAAENANDAIRKYNDSVKSQKEAYNTTPTRKEAIAPARVARFHRSPTTSGPAAPETIPPKLKEQLRVGGKMVLPLGGRDRQQMTVVKRVSETRYSTSTHGDYIFVPMKKGTE